MKFIFLSFIKENKLNPYYLQSEYTYLLEYLNINFLKQEMSIASIV